MRMLGGWSLLSLELQLETIYLHLGVTRSPNSCERRSWVDGGHQEDRRLSGDVG